MYGLYNQQVLTGPYIGRGPVKGNRVNTRVRQGLVLDDPEVNKFDSRRSKFLGLGMSTSKDVLTCPCIVTQGPLLWTDRMADRYDWKHSFQQTRYAGRNEMFPCFF